MHSIVAADNLSDRGELALTSGGLLVLSAALMISIRLARRIASRRRFGIKTAAPVALALIAITFVAHSYADTCIELRSLLDAGAADATPTVIALGPRGDDVRLAGEIRDGDGARLAALLDANPAVTRIHLTSDGGLADEGQALGDVIAAHHLTTYVPDYCVSACTLAFAGGRERLVMRDARLGFHAPYAEGVFGQVFRGDVSGARAVYATAGIAPDFIDKALAVAADDMWYPEGDRLIAAHVVTGIVDRSRFPDSNLDADPTQAGARATVLRNFPILVGLDAGSPAALIDRIAAWYLEAYRHDWSEGRVVKDLHALSDSAIALAIADADDAALVDLAHYVATAMRDADPKDCVAIGARGDLIAAAAVLGSDDADATATAATLIDAAIKGKHAAASATPRRSTLIAFQDAAPVPMAATCSALRRAYATALARPVAEAATLLRPRFAAWAQRSIVTLAAAITEPER